MRLLCLQVLVLLGAGVACGRSGLSLDPVPAQPPSSQRSEQDPAPASDAGRPAPIVGEPRAGGEAPNIDPTPSDAGFPRDSGSPERDSIFVNVPERADLVH